MSSGSTSQSPPSLDSSPTSQSNQDTSNGHSRGAKKRRTPGSCDHCRKRKARCDSAIMPGNRCSRCSSLGLECTHDGILKNLGSARSYVDNLETRLEKYEKILSLVLPDVNISTQLDEIYKTIVVDPSTAKLPRNDDDSDEARLAGQLNYLKLAPATNRFWGRSSNFMFIETALRAKDDERSVEGHKTILNTHKRSEYWSQRPWQIPSPPNTQPTPYVFPDIRLIFQLTDLYFTRVNNFFPLLHRPTFESGLADNLHHRDRGFGATVLLVIAIGSRFSSDPRVFLEDADDEHSAGWKYIRQVTPPTNFRQQITLYELQQYALYVMYGEGFMWADGWIYLGVAIRRALEVGAHRRRSSPPSAEVELWKRAMWVLLWQERSLSTFFGRPVSLQEEDFDLDYPIECDDAYWEDNFKQPPGTPSTVSMFNSLLRLAEIQAQVLRSVYKTKKHRFTPAMVSHQQFISSLDSAMNKWVEAQIPAHLVLSPSNDAIINPLFRQQSAYLHVNYYALQIYIHKPFIPLSDSPSVYPSLAISTNAARALVRVLGSADGSAIATLPSIQAKSWIAGMILLIHIWSGMRSGLAPNPQKDMEDVTKCMNILKASENRYQMSGKLRDVLVGLAMAGEVNLLKPGVTSGQKRTREEDSRPVNGSVQGGTSGLPERSPTFDFLFGTDEISAFSFPTDSSGLSQLPVFDRSTQLAAAFSTPLAFPSTATTGGPLPQQNIPPVHFSDTSYAALHSSVTPGSSTGTSNHSPDSQFVSGLTWTNGDPFAITTPPADVMMDNTGQSVTSPSQFQPIDATTLGLWGATPVSWSMYDWSRFIDANAQKIPESGTESNH